MERAIILGGPKHGEVIEGGSDYFTVAESPNLRPWEIASIVDTALTVRTINYRRMAMWFAGGRQKRPAYVHPEFKDDTAEMMMSDLMLAAWDRHLGALKTTRLPR